MVTNEWSRRFFRLLMFFAIVWMLFGIFLHIQSSEAEAAFLELYLFTVLDLVFLLLIFWEALFSNATTASAQRLRSVKISLFIVFKLVCLGLLVITLKRFRNAPFSSLFMGVAFIGVGPLMAGVFSRIPFKKGKDNGAQL
jgi:hypothetical protein